MCLLLSIYQNLPLEPVDGVLTIAIPLRTVTIVLDNVSEEFDALEDRKWIEIIEPRPKLTEKGLYALRRWLKTMVIVANDDKGSKGKVEAA